MKSNNLLIPKNGGEFRDIILRNLKVSSELVNICNWSEAIYHNLVLDRYEDKAYCPDASILCLIDRKTNHNIYVSVSSNIHEYTIVRWIDTSTGKGIPSDIIYAFPHFEFDYE